MNIIEILELALSLKASDVFIVAGRPLGVKIGENVVDLTNDRLKPEDTQELIYAIYQQAKRSYDNYMVKGDDDFSFSIKGVARFRVSAYRQRSSLAAVIRVVVFSLPHPQELNIPNTVMELADKKGGLILVTGPSGSGKSTTLACLIDRINNTRKAHVITLEDPIEYLHTHKQSIISQREISLDTESYLVALRAALRQTPNVILIGEMRDTEAMQIALTAAETGHLVLSTLHTPSVASTIDRIIDGFAPNQQHQIRLQLSMVLQAIVCQQLVPTNDQQMIPAFEVMLCNPAARNMIREAKSHQLDLLITSSTNEGMMHMDNSLFELYQQGIISRETAISYCNNPEIIIKKIDKQK
jgi:twitching motility protein PilT